MESRIEKFANLRSEISKQIELDQEFGEINEFINNYMLKLNEINSEYFMNVRNNFEQEFNWEKLFIDRNLENQSYNPSFKKELLKLYDEMKLNAPILNHDDKTVKLVDDGKIIPNFLEKNNLIINTNNLEYQKLLNSLLAKKVEYCGKSADALAQHKNFNIQKDNLTLKEITEIRNKDSRLVEEMIKNIALNFEEKETVLLINYQKFYSQRKKILWLLIISIILVTIVLLVSLVLFFIL